MHLRIQELLFNKICITNLVYIRDGNGYRGFMGVCNTAQCFGILSLIYERSQGMPVLHNDRDTCHILHNFKQGRD